MKANTVFEKYLTPEEAGVSSKGLLAFLKAAQKLSDKVQFHSLILLRHGKEVCRFNWAPYDDRTPHTLFSLSKSFTSAAAGFAMAEGLLREDSPVTEILPEEIPEGREKELSKITLGALLSMGSGLAEESDSPSPNPDVTWARHVLSHELKYEPMTHFHYNTFGTYLVSCMVQKVTGETLTDYLYPRLFEPLGIEKPVWDMSPEGICCGGFGLHLTSESIARFGQLLLNRGVWQGKQVLPEGWVEKATSQHIANYSSEREEGNEWGQGYGWQFWRCIGGRYRGDGAFGQICMIDEKLDAVLAVTCATNDMGAEYKLIRDYIFTAFDGEAGTEKDFVKLTEKAENLCYEMKYADDDTEKTLPAGEFKTAHRGNDVFVTLQKFSYEMIKLSIRFGNNPWDAFDYYLSRGAMALAGVNVYQRNTFFGGYSWKNGRLFVTLRSVNGPDTLEGSFTWTAKKLTFNGIGIDFPNGKTVFEKI